MKKLLLLIGIIIITGTVISQSVNEECVTCKNNEINFDKYSSAIGIENVSTGDQSFVGGTSSFATGNYSFAFGYRAVAGSISTLALGYKASANGMYSTAIGRGSLASGDAAFALGYKNTAQATSSYVFGEYIKSVAGGTVTLGMGAGEGENNLINNKAYSLMVGFNSNIPTFYVGNSSGINKTGRIGIGNVTTPEAKLHIKADASENATLFLQSSDWNSKYAEIQLGTTGNAIKAEKDIGLIF
ncbi:MAG: hypothetical protein K8R68_03430, partial [Bacteroidales bacterium]|nr:hypothetical protein [Bacteroidales bacterium]